MTHPIVRQEKVAVALVTHNRAECLKRLLDSLRLSTHPLHSIWVVDNCSTDGTIEMLARRKVVEPSLNVIRLPENRGGAGGFASAIESAFQSGADWIWVMDDDVTIFPDALARLLPYQKFGLCLHGVRLQPNNQVLPFEQWMNVKTGFTELMREKSFRQGKSYCFMNVGCFEGMLIHRSIVQRIGLPDAQFFLTEDDAYYGYLASKLTNVLYVNEVVMRRQLSRPRCRFFFFKEYLSAPEHHLYYFIRNKFLMYQKLRAEEASRPIRFGLRLARYVVRVSLLYGVYERDFKKLRAIISGVGDGLRGHFGPRGLADAPSVRRVSSSWSSVERTMPGGDKSTISSG